MIGERLKLLRRESGMTKRELIAVLPFNYSTYANYESGFREPNSEVLQLLARHFNCSIDYLLGMTDSRKRVDDVATLTDAEHDFMLKYRALDAHGRELVNLVLEKESERVTFPNEKPLPNQRRVADDHMEFRVYRQRSSAGLGNYGLGENGDDYERMSFIVNPTSEKADFCIRIKGDSMEPKINDGDIVFVKSVPCVEPGNVGIFYYEGETYCKRLRVDARNGAIHLESLNKSYAPKNITQPENLRTVGLVIGKADRPLREETP